MSNTSVTWVLESQVFPASHPKLREAILGAGHRIIDWQDEWWLEGSWPQPGNTPTIFHGSLENATRIRQTLNWHPGSYCDTAAFYCSTWYPHAQEWLLHRKWKVLPAAELATDPSAVLAAFDYPDAVFVRPDSPLKPFSGRVLARDQISLEALDFGFYFDDPTTPVIVAPVREIVREWRYVVVDRRIVAGSAYLAQGRTATPDDPGGEPWNMAAEVAACLNPPEQAYVLDVCESDGELWLLELNPFSGADLYACQSDEVVAAISDVSIRSFQSHIA